MRALGLVALLLWQAGVAKEPPVAQPEYLRWERNITVPAGSGQACAAIDGTVFPHAAPSLRDLRVFPVLSGTSPSQVTPGAHEIPYVITLSQTATETTEPVRVFNLGGSGSHIVFDLKMPARPYSDVRLELAGQDFLATATVWGEDGPGAASGRRTSLGSFTLFDLTTQRLSRDMTLPLVESTFPFLHVELAVTAAPGTQAGSRFVPAMVTGAQVPPSRIAQTVYTTVAETTAITTSGRETTAALEIPARVPVERVSFVIAPEFKGNFSRDVRITASPSPPAADAKSAPSGAADSIESGADLRNGALPRENLFGTILRVHATEAGHEIRTEQLSVPSVLGANLQTPAKIEITLNNGDDRPLPIAAVRLEMRQRKLCFEAGPETAAGIALFYGDPVLDAPVYDYGRFFRAAPAPLAAALGPELVNPTFHTRPERERSFTERHPEVLWIALIAVVCALGMVAFRSAKRVGA